MRDRLVALAAAVAVALGLAAPVPAAGERATVYRVAGLDRPVELIVDHWGVFVARRDRQVKIRGQRVELGEIESVLLSRPDVRGAVVTVESGALTAYVVTAVTAELRGFLAERLPAYMVPSRLVEVSEIPVTRNGKVDLQALAAMTPTGGTAGGTLTALEQRLVDRCYATALPGVSVAPEDDFFALGGTSLQAIRLMSLVRKLVGTEVPLAEFFRRPTLRALAAAIDTKGSTP